MWVLLSMTCHVKEHTLSLNLWVVVRRKKKQIEGEDKVENDAKQKNRWKQKWVQDLSIENEYKKWK